MKKLLLTSAVLVGMCASQAFAALDDVWTAQIDLTAGAACKLSDAEVQVTAGAVSAIGAGGGATAQGAASGNANTGTNGLTAIDLTALVSDTDNLLTEAFVTEILFSGQSYCNNAHTLNFKSQFNGFIAQDKGNVDATSDAFLTGIPHSEITISGWHANANALSTGAGHKAIGDLTLTGYAPAPADSSAWDLLTGNQLEATAIPAWHNDGETSTVSGTTAHGLLFTIKHTPDGASQILPMLKGTYTDRFYLKVSTTA